jgi:hypothetical protein
MGDCARSGADKVKVKDNPFIRRLIIDIKVMRLLNMVKQSKKGGYICELNDFRFNMVAMDT